MQFKLHQSIWFLSVTLRFTSNVYSTRSIGYFFLTQRYNETLFKKRNLFPNILN